MKKYKILLVILWFLALTLGPITVLKTTPILFALRNPTVLFNTLQRIAGLAVFSTLFFYIILDFFGSKFLQKFGNWLSGFISVNKLTIYAFMLLYQFSFLLLNYYAKHGFDPFYVFTDVCFLCSTKFEAFFTLGRVAFWFLSVSTFAWLFRDSSKWLRSNWEIVQNLNYLSFFLIGILLFFFEGYALRSPYIFFYIPAVLLTTILSGYKLFKFVKTLIANN